MDALPDFGPPQPAWLTNLPKLGPVAPAPPPPTSFLPAMGSALASGALGVGSDLARTVQGIGALTGLPKLQAFGAAGAKGSAGNPTSIAWPSVGNVLGTTATSPGGGGFGAQSAVSASGCGGGLNGNATSSNGSSAGTCYPGGGGASSGNGNATLGSTGVSP